MNLISRLQKYYLKLAKLLPEGNIVPDDIWAFLDNVEDINLIDGIIIGQDPYPYTCPTSGKPHAAGVLFASNCRKPPKDFLVFKQATEIALKEELNVYTKIKPDMKIFKKWNILLLYSAWSTILGYPSSHTGRYFKNGKFYSYKTLNRGLVKELIARNENMPLPILTLGEEAYKIVEGLEGNFKHYYTIHPAATGINNLKFNIRALKFFYKAVNNRNNEIT